MIILAGSAALVGFLHSLAPGHWLPVVLVAKARRWSVQTVLLGAAVAASGHIIISNLLGAIAITIGVHLFTGFEEEVERYGSLILVIFGLIYAIYAYFRHHSCHGHTHHGPHPKKGKAPFAFLFSLGFSPCIAVLPVFATASAKGATATLLAMIGFSLGVLLSLGSATVLATQGLAKLDHPILEHYGDVLTGIGIVLMGVVLFFNPL